MNGSIDSRSIEVEQGQEQIELKLIEMTGSCFPRSVSASREMRALCGDIQRREWWNNAVISAVSSQVK